MRRWAGSSVASAVAYYLFGGEEARTLLDDFRVWLSLNNAAVMTVLFVIIGAVLIAKGLDLLTL